MFQRRYVQDLKIRMAEPRKFIQIVMGPRQVGKTTTLTQALKAQELPYLFVRADAARPPTADWLRSQWVAARSLLRGKETSAILVIDEVQKIERWSDEVKDLWDEDAFDGIDLRVVLCGSSSLLLGKGLVESLQGRFEVLRMPHWTFSECHEAFGLDLDEFLMYGGYPGAMGLRKDESRWLSYMNDSIIDSTITNDILTLERVQKPALLQALFRLGVTYSAQEVSYRKLMGQLDDAGNATTIAHYLDLLGRAGMLAAIPKFGDKEITVRNSTPRLMAYDTSLITASAVTGRSRLLSDHVRRGHLVESAVGAYLLGRASQERFVLQWWREDGKECDFIVRSGEELVAIEVKSGANTNVAGTAAFIRSHPTAERIIVGPSDESIIQFLEGRTF